jgi:hypothetical protein
MYIYIYIQSSGLIVSQSVSDTPQTSEEAEANFQKKLPMPMMLGYWKMMGG